MTRQRGQALVETALILPLLLLYALGILAVGEVVREYMAVRSAATQAAFAAARAPSASSAVSAGRLAARDAVSLSRVRDFTVALEVGTFARGGVATATATGYVDLGPFPIVREVLGERFRLRWRSRALIEPYRSRQA